MSRGNGAGPGIGLKHGAGGRAMRELIRDLFLDGVAEGPEGGIGPLAMDDGAAIPHGDGWLVITTDSHVIQPPFFPGGDIGRLAVAGTVNDLAVMGATEVLALTCGVIVEEGYPRADLEKIQGSIRSTCLEAEAPLVAGDTKVMGRGEVDGIVLSTTGVALTRRIVPDAGLRPGDVLLVTGTVGDHGLAVMAKRNELAIEGDLRSDVAPLNALLRAALEAAGEGGVTAMKDPTRGGLASALHEMAEKSGMGVLLDERAVPLSREVRAVADLLGIDPLHVANEGKAVLAVRPEVEGEVLAAVRASPLGARAARIGVCTEDRPGSVVLDTGFGRRLLTEPEGEPLPRIC